MANAPVCASSYGGSDTSGGVKRLLIEVDFFDVWRPRSGNHPAAPLTLFAMRRRWGSAAFLCISIAPAVVLAQTADIGVSASAAPEATPAAAPQDIAYG